MSTELKIARAVFTIRKPVFNSTTGRTPLPVSFQRNTCCMAKRTHTRNEVIKQQYADTNACICICDFVAGAFRSLSEI